MKRSSVQQSSSHRSRVWLVVAAALILLTLAGTIYVGDYYHADSAVKALIEQAPSEIQVISDNNRMIFRPAEAEAGLIFYPGAKVEYTAYTPLMLELAENNILCVLLQMPLNLAILGKDSADSVYADFPEINTWIIAGHSLGGAMAASYAAEHSDQLDALVLLAGYSTSNLKESGLYALSIYGSEDKVLNREKYEKYRGNLPADMTELVIAGGNHAGFAFYGPQSGDGIAVISKETQIHETAAAIYDFFVSEFR